MKKPHALVTLAVAALLVLATPFARAQQAIVVELFTSEGCSSCPSADALLSELSMQPTAEGVELILLGEHVEYWNRLGWQDRFSAPAFTQRQYDYVHQLHLATAYTPQVVVDGRFQALGSNATALRRMISEAARITKPARVSLELAEQGRLHISVNVPTDKKLEVWIAVTEDNLTTNVRAGENDGRLLKHAAVTRELRQVGTTFDGLFEKTVKLPEKPDWKRADLRALVLVQEPNAGPILGAAAISLSPRTPKLAGRQ